MEKKQISLLWRHRIGSRPMVGGSCHRRGSSVIANEEVSWRRKASFQDVLGHRVNSRQPLSLRGKKEQSFRRCLIFQADIALGGVRVIRQGQEMSLPRTSSLLPFKFN